MNGNKSQEHSIKETLKTLVDNSPNYSEQTKKALKGIIDTSKSYEEIATGVLSYLSTFPQR